MHFGATLRLLRVDAGLSLRALAERIGVSSAYLSRVENGHDPVPTPDRLRAIAGELGVPPAVLVDLARQTGPAVAGYLQRVPAAGSLFLDVARRNLGAGQIARIKAFVEAEFPSPPPRGRELRLGDLLASDRVVLRLTCHDVDDLIDVAAARLGPAVGIPPRELARRILAREAEAPTCLGGGVLAPHATVERNVAAALLTAGGLQVATPDGVPARVAIVVAGRPPLLPVLARIARLARDGAVEELVDAATPARALAILERIESLW